MIATKKIKLILPFRIHFATNEKISIQILFTKVVFAKIFQKINVILSVMLIKEYFTIKI